MNLFKSILLRIFAKTTTNNNDMRTPLLLIISTILVLILPNKLIGQNIDSTIVGPGVIYYHEQILEAGPFNLDILKIDLTNPNIQLESIKGSDRMGKLEKTSSMSARYSTVGHKVVAATNGDYWTNGGYSVRIDIVNGEVAYQGDPNVGGTLFVLNKLKVPAFLSGGSGTYAYNTVLCIGKTSSLSLDNQNAAYIAGKSVLYNSFFAASTSVPSGVTELAVTPINGWIVNDTTKCVVTAINTTGNTTLTKGMAVVAGEGSTASFLQTASVGDTVKFFVGIQSGIPTKITQAVGGSERLVYNGKASIFGDATRNPRTAIGYSKDSKTLYIISVDGRQNAWSLGMTLDEIAYYMISRWNIYQGINLDGGGSSTMVVGDIVKNRFSDPTERPVCEGILLVSTAPTGSLSKIAISPKKVFGAKGDTKRFEVNGFDQYNNPVVTSGQTLNWSCSSNVGLIDAYGNLTISQTPSDGYVYLKIGTIKDSALIYISSPTKIVLTPNTVILNPTQIQKINAKIYDAYDNLMNIPATSLTWIERNNVGTITTDGTFTATKIGQGKIVVKYNNMSDSLITNIGIDGAILCDDFSGKYNYTFSGSRVDLSKSNFSLDPTIYSSIYTSGKLTYTLAVGGQSTASLFCDIPISGTPKSLLLNVYGDGKGHQLRTEVTDKNGNLFRFELVPVSTGINWTNSWHTLEVDFSTAIPVTIGTTLTFPISLNRIYMYETDEAKKNSGTLYFDDLKTRYAGIVSRIALTADSIKLMPGESKTVIVQAFDHLNIPIVIGDSVYNWSIKDITGSINNHGKFSTTNTGFGKVIVKLGSLSDSLIINSKSLQTGIEDFTPIQKFELKQNFPNPFSQSTTIEYSIPKLIDIEIAIYNIYGKKLVTLVKGNYKPGKYQVDWVTNNYPSGTYIYKLISEGVSISRKMLLIK